MQVRFINGERKIEATKPELACMRKALGLFVFVFDTLPGKFDGSSDCEESMLHAISVCAGEVEEVPEAAGEVT